MPHRQDSSAAVKQRSLGAKTSKMAVLEIDDNDLPLAANAVQKQQAEKKPWVETPLRECYALSQAAGWYGLPFFSPPRFPFRSHVFVFPNHPYLPSFIMFLAFCEVKF